MDLLYTQLALIVEYNFADNEVNLQELITGKQLYFITEDRKVFFINRVVNMKMKNKIASICFVKNNHFYLVATCVNFMRQGYAFSLLKFILDILKTANLNVRSKNQNAIDLYSKLGFIQKCIKPNYYDQTSIPDDGIEMEYNEKTKTT
jgi:ribosomal protein S18 acetylase RimI-like enzyme